MNIESQVVSLAISRELKENGYEQGGIWWWRKYNTWLLETGDIRYENGWTDKEVESIVAPTVAELGERLPKFYMSMHNGMGDWVCEDFNTYSHPCYKYDPMNTEANARAKCWLYLKKEGLL